jgi:hypothetical protein
MGMLLFLSTLSFLFTAPGVTVASAGGFPVLSVLPGQFPLKADRGRRRPGRGSGGHDLPREASGTGRHRRKTRAVVLLMRVTSTGAQDGRISSYITS